MRLIVLCLTVIVLKLYAAEYCPLDGTQFPNNPIAGPTLHSKSYQKIVNPIAQKGSFFLKLDESLGAKLYHFSDSYLYFSHKGQDHFLEDYREPSLFKEVKIYHLTMLDPKVYELDFMKSLYAEEKFLVTQPNSQIELLGKVLPYMVRPKQTIYVQAWLGEVQQECEELEFWLKAPNGVTTRMKQEGNRFVGSWVAGQQDLHREEFMTVFAKGRYKESLEFERDLKLSFRLVPQGSYFDGEIEMSARGDLNLLLVLKQNNRYRLDIIYGFGEKSVGYTAHHFAAESTRQRMRVPRQDKALFADKALLRLIDMETLRIEDRRVVTLPQLEEANEAQLQSLHILKPPLSEKQHEITRWMEEAERDRARHEHPNHHHD